MVFRSLSSRNVIKLQVTADRSSIAQSSPRYTTAVVKVTALCERYASERKPEKNAKKINTSCVYSTHLLRDKNSGHRHNIFVRQLFN